MTYELHSTEVFDDWLTDLDGSLRRRLANRLAQVESGHFGDHKALAADLFELRCFFGGGLRLYFTQRGERIVLLLAGGDKSSQSADIARVRAMLADLED
ncbi:MAG: type II toxin-antitoxin system RelE/ParE family toxin [Azonexus sp.]|nr:type II toxin-antitoxin system RelE/ParE family toxin [Azonexus sp.]MCK6412675.1 type II toxin-antitoxin system RelE/ParE family toxin [Azonexus sp.]